MTYEAFDKYRSVVDEANRLVHCYEDEEGNRFYVEPGFYEGLMGFREKRAEDFPRIMAALDETVKKNHKVIFTADFESPWISRDGYIYREIFDLTDPLGVFVEDKSRGSDYGD